MRYVLGIDPGAHGAMALISETHLLEAVCFDKLGSARKIADRFLEWSFLKPTVFMEKVHARPGQGVTSMFTFGKNCGLLEGILYAYRMPFEEVLPLTWQKGAGQIKKYAIKKDRKNALKQLAQRYFPDSNIVNDNADAVLIAEYGYRLLFRSTL